MKAQKNNIGDEHSRKTKNKKKEELIIIFAIQMKIGINKFNVVYF